MTIQVYPEPSSEDATGGIVSTGSYGNIGDRTNYVTFSDTSKTLPAGIYEWSQVVDGNNTTGAVYLGSVGTTATTSGSGIITTTAASNFKIRVQSRWEAGSGPIGSTGVLSSVDYYNEYLIISGSRWVTAALTGAIFISTDNSSFTEVNPIPSANLIYNVIYDGTFYIAGHRNDGIIVSTNLVNWTTRTFVSGSAPLMGRYAAGSSFFKYVFGGQSGNLIVSTNGTTWTTRTSNILGNLVTGNVRYLNGNWFTFGATAQISLSTNGGNNWNLLSTSNLPSADFVQDVAYGNNVYVAVSNFGNIIWSSNGINWTTSDLAQASNFVAGQQFISVIQADGYFVAAGSNNRSIYTSTNGNNWQLVTSAAITSGVSCAVMTAISIPSTSVNYPTSRFYLVFGETSGNLGPASYDYRINGEVSRGAFRRWSNTLAGRTNRNMSAYVKKITNVNSLTTSTS